MRLRRDSLGGGADRRQRGSLISDAILVALGKWIFPPTQNFSHFQFSDYAKLTIVGVTIACIAWPVVTGSLPAALAVPAAAVLVTLVLWLPDLWILAQGERSAAWAVLMLMHLAIALVTYPRSSAWRRRDPWSDGERPEAGHSLVTRAVGERAPGCDHEPRPELLHEAATCAFAAASAGPARSSGFPPMTNLPSGPEPLDQGHRALHLAPATPGRESTYRSRPPSTAP